MSLKTSVENYKKAKSIYLEIDDKFLALEKGEIEGEFELNQLIKRTSDLEKTLRYVNLDDIKSNYPREKFEAVKHNFDVFTDAQYYWKRFFVGAKYASSLLDPLSLKYVPGLDLDFNELSRYGGNEKKLVKGIIGIITHPEHIMQYVNSIKRIVLGTMTQKEFNRIFDTIKHRIGRVHEGRFSFSTKFLLEDFFNPFDEEEKDTTPKHISDKSSPLMLRKETFNLSRVEFSKRPGGESTVLAKTHFASGEIVEICPTVILGEEAKAIDKIKDIVFEIDKENNQWALVLGYGSLYRHADKPNLDYAFNKTTKQMYFITKRPVKQGEELTINYGQEYWAERTTFNTIAQVPNGNESQVQPNAVDGQNKANMVSMSTPNNKNNPVISGVAIVGNGQS